MAGHIKPSQGAKLQSRWITKAESTQILNTRSFITSSGNPILFLSAINGGYNINKQHV